MSNKLVRESLSTGNKTKIVSAMEQIEIDLYDADVDRAVIDSTRASINDLVDMVIEYMLY